MPRYRDNHHELLPTGSNQHRRHTTATIHLQTWRDNAACAGEDPDLWYPEPGPEGRLAAKIARAICADCPVRLDCLAAALTGHEELGIWGGTTERQRRTIRAGLRQLAASRSVEEVA